MAVLEGLEPRGVFKYFEKIASIPHGSGNTKQLSDYLCAFAKERNLEYYQDEINNVIIIKEASEGYTDTVILQGHMDMVCQKTMDYTKDMAKEGIDLYIDGDLLKAKGTTLGGDDGMAVAMMLALLDDESIKHPRLECVFTVDEETTLGGAEFIDVAPLKGKKFINLDSEDEGYATVSCAGGASSKAQFEVTREAFEGKTLEIQISGLTGGHSGVEINKGFGSAHKDIARLCYEILRKVDMRLVAIGGGTADNVIPKESMAVVKVKDYDKTLEIIKEFEEVVKHERKFDPGYKVTVKEVTEAMTPMDEKSTKQVVSFMHCAPNGIQELTIGMENFPQTSLSLGIVDCQEDNVLFVFAVRSSVDSEREMVCHKLEALANAIGGKYDEEGVYPGWEYQLKSDLRDLVCQVYTEQTGKELVVEAIHAGLECGFFSQKIPGLDCVSIGPNMRNVHTTEEYIEIGSTERVWKTLLEVLARLK
ncbi:MAG: aminoacyl-histidine dipeptidase [Clostridia bacterium]|nr:aminoacyl-histidine dipeptidase [Clostridia bacterium]